MGVASGSYVGRYGPELVRHIQERNANEGTIEIGLSDLAINDGLSDYRVQEPAMAEYMLGQGLIDRTT
jgi:hypothetical protein